jgi:sortase (surface protein transpeptidase)
MSSAGPHRDPHRTDPGSARPARGVGRSWTVLAIVLAVIGVGLMVAAAGGALTGPDEDRPTVAATSRAQPSSSTEPSGSATPGPTKPPASAPTRPRVAAADLAAALPSARPTEVRIPAIDVKSTLVSLGVGADGRMEVTHGPRPAGWFDGSPTPGSLGPAVLAGHVTWNGTDGVFHHLADLRRGDQVEVDRADGATAVFEVTRAASYDKDHFPTDKVYGAVPAAELRLITCGGHFDGDSYSHNLVVYATLVATREGAAG